MRPRLAAPLLVLLVVVSGCGTASTGSGGQASTRSLAPVAALRTAVGAWGDGSSLALTIHYGGTRADLLKVIAATAKPAGLRLKDQIASVVLGSSLSVRLHDPRGHPLKAGFDFARLGRAAAAGSTIPAEAGADSQVVLTMAAAPVVELRVVAGDVFARADVGLLAGFSAQPDDPTDIDLAKIRATGRAKIATSLLAFPVTGGLSFIPKAADGAWLSLPQSQLRAMQSLAQGAAAAAGSGYQARAGALIEGLGRTLADLPDKGLTVVRDPKVSGGDDVLTVTTSGKQLADAFLPLLAQAVPAAKLPTDAGAPTTPIPFTVTIRGGVLSRVSFDIKPFLARKDRLAIGAADVTVVLDASTAPVTIEAPAGATQIDALAAFAQLGAMKRHHV